MIIVLVSSVEGFMAFSSICFDFLMYEGNVAW